MTPDIELVLKIKQGDEKAFETLFQRYVDKVHRHLKAMVFSSADVDDLVQEVFVRVYRKLATYKEESTFSTWLYRITRNVAISHIRSMNRRKPSTDFEENTTLSDDWIPTTTPLNTAMQSQEMKLASRFLNKLSNRKKEVFVLHEVAGFTLEEIAEMVDCPMYTVASRLRTARQEALRWSERLRMREEAQHDEAMAPSSLPYARAA